MGLGLKWINKYHRGTYSLTAMPSPRAVSAQGQNSVSPSLSEPGHGHRKFWTNPSGVDTLPGVMKENDRY